MVQELFGDRAKWYFVGLLVVIFALTGIGVSMWLEWPEWSRLIGAGVLLVGAMLIAYGLRNGIPLRSADDSSLYDDIGW